MENFNKLIDLKIETDSEAFEIKTPRNGPKPQIKISGNLTAGGFIQNFQIECTNFFSNSINNAARITVKAGYEGNMSAGISGEVQNVYTASPGPDKVTVISCASASFDSWISKTINLKLKAGFSLQDAIYEVTNALGFEPAEIDAGIASKICAAPLYMNGKCSEAIKLIKDAFNGIAVTTDGKKLRVFSLESTRKTVVVHTLPFLTQAPQFSGGLVNLTAPWNPMVKPGDYVKFPIDFKQTSQGSLVSNEASITSIQFSFSTDGDENEMVLTGTVTSQLKEA